MYLAGVEGAAHAARWGRETPGNRSTADARFESAVPQNGAGKIEILRSVREAQGFLPHAACIADLPFFNQTVGERDSVRELEGGMHGYQTMPHRERRRDLVIGAQLANDREIAVAIGGKNG